MQLRSYQQTDYDEVHAQWARPVCNVLVVEPTGAGKTILAAQLIKDFDGPALFTAHRRELVGQISVALAKCGVPHRIIAPTKVIRLCVARQVREAGRSLHEPNARVAIASVDTLLTRADRYQFFLQRVKLHVVDEAHHVLHNPINKWGRACNLTPKARILGFTATALRADGNGLGRHANGVFDVIVQGVKMRWLIENGYLKKYRVFNASSHALNLTQDDISATTGDYKRDAMGRAAQEIVGDVVATYVQYAMGKRGITFAPTVEIGRELAQRFNDAGVPAMCVSDKTSDEARESAVRRLGAGELLQLVNVDLFGEGFDLPAIEVASFARPTLSYGLYVQQFGRPLRPTPGVDTAIIFDHVGNVLRHGLPDGNVRYTLDATERHRQVKGALLARACANCGHDYERAEKACPYCGWVPEIQDRSAPSFVDGDLTELDPEALKRLRGEAAAAVQPVEEYEQSLRDKFCPPLGIRRHARIHGERIGAQGRLRDAIALWGGYQRDSGTSDSRMYRDFYHTFGVDVLSAQALNTAGSAVLELKILRELSC